VTDIFPANWTVFKDGGNEEKQKDPTSSTVKCYFVRMQSGCSADEGADYILSNKTVSEARTLFMHAHMLLPNLNKYMARYDTCANTKYYYHLEFHLFFLHPPAVPLKIDFMQCTNLIGIQVLSHSVKDLETQHWLDNCECPKNTRWILQGIVNFKLPYGFYILWPCLQNFYYYFFIASLGCKWQYYGW